MSATREHNMFNPKMEAISRDELHALQSERLRWTVKHEYDNVPVYRARMDAKGIRPEDIRDVDDLKYLPFMEKTDLRDQFPYGLLAAPLHDIGKVGIDDAILNKPGRLNDLEFDAMRHHTLLGARAIQRAIDQMGAPTFLDVVKEMTLYHHERWDGMGYPFGLQGEEIPLCARIMAVADV